MPSERVQRQIDRLLDEAETALGTGDWATVRVRAEAVLRLDAANADAQTYLTAAGEDAQAEVAPSAAPPAQSR